MHKRSFEYLGKAYSWQTIIDYQGKEIINFSNKSVEDIIPNGKVIFRDEDGKYGVKGLKGKSINISTASSNQEELKAITLHNHWGYMDNTGKIIIPIILIRSDNFIMDKLLLQ